MSFRESARAAFGALRANVVRSFLALLGIVIGVAAVITMVSIGMGARSYIDAQIDGAGRERRARDGGCPATRRRACDRQPLAAHRT